MSQREDTYNCCYCHQLLQSSNRGLTPLTLPGLQQGLEAAEACSASSEPRHLQSHESGKVPCPSPVSALRRASPAPHRDSLEGLALVEGVWQRWSRGHAHGRGWPHHLPAVRWHEHRGDTHSQKPEAVRRVGPKVIRVGDLVPSLVSCSSRESGSCTSLVQYSRAGSDGDCMGELALRL